MLKILSTIILYSILVVSDANRLNPFGACLKLFIPEDLTTSCAAHTHDIVRIIRDCIRERPFQPNNFYQSNIPKELSTCDQAKCVTGRYGLQNSRGELNIHRARKRLKDLDRRGDLLTKRANKLISDFCLDKDYRVFISQDPQCTHWSFLNCAFWAYRLVNHVNEDLQWIGKCRAIYDNVKACFSKKDLFYDFLSKDFSNQGRGRFIK